MASTTKRAARAPKREFKEESAEESDDHQQNGHDEETGAHHRGKTRSPKKVSIE